MLVLELVLALEPLPALDSTSPLVSPLVSAHSSRVSSPPRARPLWPLPSRRLAPLVSMRAPLPLFTATSAPRTRPRLALLSVLPLEALLVVPQVLDSELALVPASTSVLVSPPALLVSSRVSSPPRARLRSQLLSLPPVALASTPVLLPPSTATSAPRTRLPSVPSSAARLVPTAQSVLASVLVQVQALTSVPAFLAAPLLA